MIQGLGNIAIYSAHCDVCGWKADGRQHGKKGDTVYFQRPAAEEIVATDHRNEGKCAAKVVITALEIRMER